MVTNAVAIHGIGNRPGTWDMLSGPRFPYGRRPMALPIWAHARGKTYPTIVMAERTGLTEVRDRARARSAGTRTAPRPSPTSAGRWRRHARPIRRRRDHLPDRSSTAPRAPRPDPLSSYPPRTDLTSFARTDSRRPPTYSAINDLDTVAAATPAYGALLHRDWLVPGDCRPATTR